MAAHALLVTLLALSPLAPPGQAQDAERTPHELRTAVRAAMRRQATTGGAEQVSAVRELLTLYDEVGANKALTPPERQRWRAYLHSRLRRTSQALERQLARRDNAADRAQPGAGPPAAAVRNKLGAQAILAQKPGNQAGPPAAGPPRQANFPAAGAAAQVPGGGQSWNAMTAQNAQQLIDLIQNTIAPHTWDTSGGHGVIRYFAPAQVLVIRQSGDVHGRIGEALEGLRK
jgi:hypothetical protein